MRKVPIPPGFELWTANDLNDLNFLYSIQICDFGACTIIRICGFGACSSLGQIFLNMENCGNDV